ncbi:MAG: DUF3108 domain-containing protein [Gemmatimonadaceae bacterium]
MKTATRTLALALAFAAPLHAQAATAPLEIETVTRPFAPGEKLTYAVKVPLGGGGTAVAEIIGIDTVRGREVYHTVFRVNGSMLLFKVRDRYESWFDPNTLVSLRYHQDIDEGPYERNRTYEIFPGDKYIDQAKQEHETVDKPLDDGAFLYFLRTIPLEVGKTYTWNRYFKPDRNPVRVTVVRKERIRVPAGEFDAFVLQPKIKAKGIFAEGANAEVWIADDDTRMMLQMKTRLPFGSVQFQLRSREFAKPIANR